MSGPLPGTPIDQVLRWAVTGYVIVLGGLGIFAVLVTVALWSRP